MRQASAVVAAVVIPIVIVVMVVAVVRHENASRERRADERGEKGQCSKAFHADLPVIAFV